VVERFFPTEAKLPGILESFGDTPNQGYRCRLCGMIRACAAGGRVGCGCRCCLEFLGGSGNVGCRIRLDPDAEKIFIGENVAWIAFRFWRPMRKPSQKVGQGKGADDFWSERFDDDVLFSTALNFSEEFIRPLRNGRVVNLDVAGQAVLIPQSFGVREL